MSGDAQPPAFRRGEGVTGRSEQRAAEHDAIMRKRYEERKAGQPSTPRFGSKTNVGRRPR